MKLFQLIKLSFLLITIIIITSCANTQTANNKCRHVNWYRLGHHDASNGKNKRNLQKDFESCGLSFNIDQATYNKGWQQGIKLYCNPRNGLALGMQGRLYNNVCPDNQISAFDKAWKDGLREYCTPSNGYKRGIEGGAFPGYCSPDLNPSFKRAYIRGHAVYRRFSVLKKQYEEENVQIQKLQNEIVLKQNSLQAETAKFQRAAFSPAKQYQLRKQQLAINKLQKKLVQLTARRDVLQQQYLKMKKRYMSAERN